MEFRKKQGCHIGKFIARFRKSAFGYKYLGWRCGEFLAIFWKHLAPNFLVWRNVRPVYLHVFAHIFICRFTIFKLADGLKIHDIEWKCESFESRSIVLNTSCQICLQNVETDNLQIFAKCWKPIRFLLKFKANDERALNDWFPVTKLMFWQRCNNFKMFGEFLLSLAIFWSEFGDSFLFPSGNPGIK